MRNADSYPNNGEKNDIMTFFSNWEKPANLRLCITFCTVPKTIIHKAKYKIFPDFIFFSEEANRGEKGREAKTEHYPAGGRENKVALTVVLILGMRMAVVRKKPPGASIQSGFGQPGKSPRK